MKGHLDGTWDALDGAQIKLEQAKEDVWKTVLDFSQAYRGLIQEKRCIFNDLKYQGIEKKAAEVFCDHAQNEEEMKQRRKQHKWSGTSHLSSYPPNPHCPIVISTLKMKKRWSSEGSNTNDQALATSLPILPILIAPLLYPHPPPQA
jgi:hypothetical protein